MHRLDFLFISAALTITFLSSCRIDRDLSPLSQHVKDWASFKEGSYWVYQNDSTATMDSIFVGFNGTDTYPSADNTYDVETVNTTITNTSEDLLGFIFGVGFKEIVFQDFSLEPEYEANGGFNMEGDSIVEETIELGYSNCVVNKVENQTINNTTYENVIHVKVNPLDANDQIITEITYEYWIAKNHWIIKKTYSSSGKIYSWSLLRSNIVQ